MHNSRGVVHMVVDPRRTPSPRGTKSLVELARTASDRQKLPDLRVAAALDLYRAGAPDDALSRLKGFLTGSDGTLRWRAVNAIAQIASVDDRALALVAKAMTDREALVRLHAIYNMADMDPDFDPIP